MADSSRSGNRQPLCLTCWHWQGALDLPTGTIGQLYACIRQVPGAGSRFECNQYDRDPMRAKIEFVESPSPKRRARIHRPPDADFADLQLELDDAGRLHYYFPDALAACCRANGLDVGTTLGDEDAACAVICEWYVAHRAAGGAPDPQCEAILQRLRTSE